MKKLLVISLMIYVMFAFVGCNELYLNQTSDSIVTTNDVHDTKEEFIDEEIFSIYELALSSGSFDGTYDEWLNSVRGPQGLPGQDGKNVSLRVENNVLQWQNEGDNEWSDLIDLDDLIPEDNNLDTDVSVVFSLNGGNLPEGYESTMSVEKGERITLPIPSKDGYEFIGWFEGETVNDTQFFNQIPFTEDTVLYAKWEKLNTELPYDGKFVAFDADVHANKPIIYSVVVTVKDGEIIDYNIDSRQSSVDTSSNTYTWNSKTKKELGDDYGMVQYGNATYEWYEQAKFIEDYWLENGLEGSLNEMNGFDGISSVTISDPGYAILASEAIEMAKNGIYQSYIATYENGKPMISWVKVDIDSNYDDFTVGFDELQSSIENDTFTWNNKTKQELGDDYGMDVYGSSEWYVQAELLAEYIENQGLSSFINIQYNNLDNVSGVSISVDNHNIAFYQLLTYLPHIDFKDHIEIWVGPDAQEFYQNKANEYISQYEIETGYEFPYVIVVKAADTGTAAGVFLDDPDAGPDILTVAHDNLGRLISGSPAISPITDQALLTQIQEQNPDSFINGIQGEYDGETYFFGAPYEAQALVLYYNSKYLTEDDVDTWEEIWEVAKVQNMRATTVTSNDGFNNSFLVLASNAQTGEMPVTIYEGGELTNTEFVNDGAISVMKWGIRFFSDPNGASQASDSGWEADIEQERTLSVIGGAWHFDLVQAALGDDMAVAKLPTFTLTEDDVYGDIPAGTVMQSGTFTDTKMFVMNSRSDKLEYLEDIIKYLSHKDIQKEAFDIIGSLPAYKGVADDITDQASTDIITELALAQIEMFEHGIAQPFGVDPRFNFYYYQRQGPELLYEMLTNDSLDIIFLIDNGDIVIDNVIGRMTEIENIWLNIRD